MQDQMKRGVRQKLHLVNWPNRKDLSPMKNHHSMLEIYFTGIGTKYVVIPTTRQIRAIQVIKQNTDLFFLDSYHQITGTTEEIFSLKDRLNPKS